MKFMPTFFRLFAVVALALSLSSCEFEEVELGFPSSITFTKAGGVKSISGDETFNYVDIHNYTTGEQGTIAPTDGALICKQLDWLRVEYELGFNTELRIIAEPNKTGKTRVLHIEIYSGAEYDTVEVRQSK